VFNRNEVIMRNLTLLGIIFSLLVPVMAQDGTVDCSTRGLNSQIDLWYNDYLNQRGAADSQESLNAATTLNTNIDALIASCNQAGELGETLEQTGMGTIESPFIVNAPATVQDMTLRVTDEIRPAEPYLIEQGALSIRPDDGQEYVLVFLSVSCAQGVINGCNITQGSFRLVGDLGTAYVPTLSNFEDFLPEAARLVAGANRVGAIPFLIDSDDTNVTLLYYPDGNAADSNARPSYFTVQGARSGVQVSSTVNELIIRIAPNRNGGTLGALRRGQTATATGRTEDGTWIYIEAPEATGWVSAEFVES